jgi:hypothetical protein
MAYQAKYRIITANKDGGKSYIYLYEDGYVGSIIEYPCVGFELQYIPKSDDIFEPIYVSQLNVTIDVTDNINNIPDFTTLNDRKYFVKVLNNDTYLDWQGWTVSEDVQFSFSTGRKDLAFTCIDGLGMIEKITYPVANDSYLTSNNTMLSYIVASLNTLQYPFDYKIISGISFYAEGMTNRSTNASAEPLSQTYLNQFSIMQDEENPVNSLQVISDIAKSFSCRFFQSNGNFYIVPLTQFAEDSYAYTIYNKNGTVNGNGVSNQVANIEGFTNNESGLYFIDNSQFKIIKKGFNKLKFVKQLVSASNYITNWSLKNFEYISVTESNAYGWTHNRDTTGLIYIKELPNNKYNEFVLKSSITNYFCSVSPNNMPRITQNEVVKFSFDIFCSGGSAPPGPAAYCIVKITITNGPVQYYLNSNKVWAITGNDYYFVPYNGNSVTADADITAQVAPITGDLAIEIILSGTVGRYSATTEANISVKNFKLDVSSFVTEVSTIIYTTDTEDYVYELDLPFGFNADLDGKFSYVGFVSDSAGQNLKNWYRRGYESDVYRSLSELVIKQYSNCLRKNVINIDSSFSGLNNSIGRLNMATRITADDTDPVQISVNNKKYILGNCTIDMPNDRVAATLLELNPTNLPMTLSTIYSSKVAGEGGGGIQLGRNRSTGFVTREAAYAAPLTTNKVFLTQGDFYSPSIGDVYYVDTNFITPFNGAALWWKVLVNDVSFRAFKISSSGVIQEIYG